jgi:phosphoglycolate phosphatase-like HAD superfamily hydrolase
MFSRKDLKDLRPEQDFFIGIDSDGCAFPSMELKHKECFIPNIVKHWQLQPVSRYVREAAEFVNLYSKWRGSNRFPALLMVFDLLAERPEVRASGARLPEVPTLRAWVEAEASPGNPALRAEVEAGHDPVLMKTLAWSEAVDLAIADMVQGVPPFPGVKLSLEKMRGRADVIVVSATPGEALLREWREHRIDGQVRLIAGQELGKKKEHLKLAAAGKYAAGKILMIGDAPGDMKAARDVGALFYPINPGSEEESWERFRSEALDRFFAGTYAGGYEAERIAAFEALLPDTPPWRRI